MLKRSWRGTTEVADDSGAVLFKTKSADWLGRKNELTLHPGVAFDEQLELLVYFAQFTANVADASDSSVAVVTAVT